MNVSATRPPARGNLLLNFVLLLALLYFASEVLIPIALAILLTFLLAAPVLGLQRRGMPRIAAVVTVALLAMAAVAGLAWIVAEQLLDLAAQLPTYHDDIMRKLTALRGSEDGVFARAKATLQSLEHSLASEPGAGAESASMTVRVAERPSGVLELLSGTAGPLLTPLANGSVVAVLVVFMLIKFEDLRDRFVRLVGHAQMNVTTQALDDAARRISRYLLMQSVINGTFGVVIAIGLLVLGVPNALLWGLLAAVLRFLPYIGPVLGAGLPLLVSFATSPGWSEVLLVVGLFLVVETLSNNVMEPWLYGSGTGVSTLAILAAAVFWTWLWGTAGLLMATPLTVCLVVLGRYVPRLGFLEVLLGDIQALAPHQRLYQRLLAMDPDEPVEIVRHACKSKPLAATYDELLVPALALAETDRHGGAIADDRRTFIYQTMRDLVEEAAQARTDPPVQPGGKVEVACVAAQDEADLLSAEMLVRALRATGVGATVVRPGRHVMRELTRIDPNIVCISAVPPAAALHARTLCSEIRGQWSERDLVVGLWGVRDVVAAKERLQTACTDRIFVAMAIATESIRASLRPVTGPMVEAPIPADESERLGDLIAMQLLDTEREPAFDSITERLTKIFDVPIALVSLIDADRQWWKAHTGLPQDLAAARCTKRSVSVCGHVVAQNQILVVPDLLKDPRFANNPLIKETGMRFYAGAPLRSESGRPIGSLCIIDIRPRRITDRETALLQLLADEVMMIVQARQSAGAAPPDTAAAIA